MPVQQHVLNWLYSVLTSEYHDVNRAYSDVAQALDRYPSLAPRTDVHTFPNGTNALLLLLSGTLPVSFRGTTYRFPVSIWVPHAYPREPPMVYVVPTETMMIRPGQHVDPQGLVYHPYLVRWAEFWDKSDLQDFLAILTEVFAKEPPVISRKQESQASRPPQPVPTPPPVPPLPPGLAPRPASTIQDQSGTVQQQRPPPPPPKAPQNTAPIQQQSPSLAGPPLPPLPKESPASPHRSSRYDSAPPLPPQTSIELQATQFASPSIQYQASQAPLQEPTEPVQHSYVNAVQPQPQSPPNPSTQWQLPPQPQAWGQPPPMQVKPQARPSPPADLLDGPLELDVPATSSIVAPPIPPNPEKDALLHQLTKTLCAIRVRSWQQNDSSMAGLQAQRNAMLSSMPSLQAESGQLTQLSNILTSNSNILHDALRRADVVIEGSKNHPVPDVDDLLVAPTVVANQLYTLVAEEKALGDAIFMLGRAMERGRISPAVFAKMTRSLAREWYLKKALVKKIGQATPFVSPTSLGANDMMESFDPFTQNATILAADGKTPIPIPLPMVDRFHTQSISICLNYGAQFGACLIMLAVILVMTPSSKFARPSSILHISSLTICTIRMALLGAYFPSHFNEFYTVWGGDYSHVPQSDFTTSIVANTFSLLLVIFVEAALMNQAWTMVSLWPTPWKYTISALSALVTLYTIGWRIAFTVVQNETIVNLVPPRNHRWVVQWMVIGNVLSICWFCLIFNIKLISHIITNRGLLPSYQAMSPMEVLVATNGVLMIVPVIFAGLEWGHFNNFESASLTLTSVAIILPLGTLAAQRMTHTSNLSGSSRSSSNRYGTAPGRGGSTARLKPSGIATNHSKTAAQVAISSRCESEAAHQGDFDISELELGKLDQEDKVNGIHVHVKHNLVQCEERV